MRTHTWQQITNSLSTGKNIIFHATMDTDPTHVGTYNGPPYLSYNPILGYLIQVTSYMSTVSTRTRTPLSCTVVRSNELTSAFLRSEMSSESKLFSCTCTYTVSGLGWELVLGLRLGLDLHSVRVKKVRVRVRVSVRVNVRVGIGLGSAAPSACRGWH